MSDNDRKKERGREGKKPVKTLTRAYGARATFPMWREPTAWIVQSDNTWFSVDWQLVSALQPGKTYRRRYLISTQQNGPPGSACLSKEDPEYPDLVRPYMTGAVVLGCPSGEKKGEEKGECTGQQWRGLKMSTGRVSFLSCFVSFCLSESLWAFPYSGARNVRAGCVSSEC